MVTEVTLVVMIVELPILEQKAATGSGTTSHHRRKIRMVNRNRYIRTVKDVAILKEVD
jgi:hypothetical protein